MFGTAAGGYFEPGVYESIRPVARVSVAIHQAAERLRFGHRVRHPPDADHRFYQRPEPHQPDDQPAAAKQPGVSREQSVRRAKIRARRRPRRFGRARKFEGKDSRITAAWSTLKSKRRAIILVASGIDTFSKINFDDVRKIIQEAGIPIYIISTGNLVLQKVLRTISTRDRRDCPERRAG